MNTHDPDFWYHNPQLLDVDGIVVLNDDDVVQLVRRVPGDGTQWEAAVWNGQTWIFDGFVLEPGDISHKHPNPERFS